MQSQATVIIPTLQHSEHLSGLLDLYAAHPRVGEIIVINNEPTRLLCHPSPKVRVLHQEQNIFVNPAWNLGFKESKFDYLIISNDDIMIAPEVVTDGLRALDSGKYPIIGLDGGSLFRKVATRPKLRVATAVNRPYGTLMFLRRADYLYIPEDILIYAGDDWLFWRQPRLNAILIGHVLQTPMAVSSGRAEFGAQKAADQAWFQAHKDLFIGCRPWHRRLASLERARERRASIRKLLGSATALIRRAQPTAG